MNLKARVERLEAEAVAKEQTKPVYDVRLIFVDGKAGEGDGNVICWTERDEGPRQ